MQHTLTVVSFFYWASAICWLMAWLKPKTVWTKISSGLEKVSLVLFTIGIVVYITRLQVINGQIQTPDTYRPLSWLLFAWALNAANLTTELVYGNRVTAIFSSLWTALALCLRPGFGGIFKMAISSDLQWLSFHRLCFVLGYAFCLLGLPVSLRFLQKWFQLSSADEEHKNVIERTLSRLDRLNYRLVLWALPLLTAGIITEALLLLEAHRLPSPEEIWLDRKETLLALATWFLCGVYLHFRFFMGWKNLKTASIYLAGLAFLLLGHLGLRIWG